MDSQIVESIHSYNHEQGRKTGGEIVTEINKINADFSTWLNDLQQKKKEARQGLENAVIQVKEVEQMYITLNSKVNKMERMIEEKKSEIKKLDALNQQYLIRKDKATARLSQVDMDFMDSLEKRLQAFRYMTGVVWNYPNCVEDHLSGYIRNVISRKVKFFQGKLNPSEIWQLIEQISN